ncbi:diguanylate cyclase [Massilia sp. Root351]|jgi:diguanylate cyclase (GGDEF)-like protein/PAS domain S-box-containing protein|uniref:EAL domain-containing protein n=1 Tax=Massilia sp. Root351 TaxID=1736522 RepID=UPI000709AEF2|nr:EAL domain-containing protein [Massilia sp. Root351]KQV90004.1 diguanylate cyclase [Massilia sp. Root351]
MTDLQKRLHMAMSAAHMAIWDSVLKDGKVAEGMVHWSPDGAALLGLPARQCEQPFRDFLAFVHPDDRDQLFERMQDAADRCRDYEVEYRVVWQDGSVHWLAAKAHADCSQQGVAERTLGIVWDITARKLQELETAEQKELAEVTLASIGDGVVTTDAKGNTRFLNRVAEQLTGWSQDLASGLPIEQTMKLVYDSPQPGDQQLPQALRADPVSAPEHVATRCLRLRQSIGVSNGTQLITRDGRSIAIEDSASPIWSGNGDMLGTVVVFRDVSHERKLTQQLSWYASHDTLTGLMNRREFEHQIAAALHSAKHEGHTHALLYIDLDQFKVVNDTCGHSAGDVLLQLLAKMLQTQMRDSDVLARLGGDELGVLLPHCPPNQAMLIADQLRQSIKNFRFVWDSRSFEIGASIGLVEINHDSKSMTDLLMAADQACYLAKEQGRNRVHHYMESDLKLAQRQGEMQWVSRLNEAFEHNYFRLFALPIVHLGTHDEEHDEVLIRIQNNKGDLILPGAFIPAAERYDLMVAIDRWVIRAVCDYVRSERGAQRSNGTLYSVNLSGTSLNDEGLHDYILAQFAEFGVDPTRICFEITETAAIANLPKAQVFMSRLKALGCRFSLDDFGSGLSSFAYLKALPVDYLKIDGMFIRDIKSNAINCALVKAINEVGHVMGMLTVAEYVEDEETLSLVRGLGVDYAQGHAVGMPRPMLSSTD